ncbi:hypothetical protein GCM10023151_20330 [Kangiella marina]|uniref:Uncharacterized protein n=1 Tax=Kangiella marina TaxID=1079178 RepID=A0ABP8IP15_9GAMM
MANNAIDAKIGSNILIAIPSNVDKKPKPSAEANEPRAGKQAVQLRAANQTPPEPTLSATFVIINEPYKSSLNYSTV